MDVTWVYPVLLAGTAFSLVLLKVIPHILNAIHPILIAIKKTVKRTRRLAYVNVLNRHGLIGPWSLVTMLFQTLYLMVNVFFLSFKVDNLSHAGRRAGTLSLINLSPVLGSLHLDFLASMLRLPLKTIKRIHRLAGFASFTLAIFHVAVAVATETSALRTGSSRVFTIIVSLSVLDALQNLTCLGGIDVVLPFDGITYYTEALL